MLTSDIVKKLCGVYAQELRYVGGFVMNSDAVMSETEVLQLYMLLTRASDGCDASVLLRLATYLFNEIAVSYNIFRPKPLSGLHGALATGLISSCGAHQ